MKYFHGTKKRKSYFEGWYLKHRRGEQAISLIPAFHVDKDGVRQASIQVVTAEHTWTVYYPAKECYADKRRFYVKIGTSIFSAKGCRIAIETPDVSVWGKVKYGRLHSLASDIMGPFCYLPGMQCRHGVLSMGHALRGKIKVNGHTMHLDGGTGYIETDRGTSFPKRYMWVQCEEKEEEPFSIMVSVADIPVAAGSFTGCICAICYGAKEYRLATYRNVRIRRWEEDGIFLTQGKYQLLIELNSGSGQPLQAPRTGSMDRVIEEQLLSNARFRFWENQKLVFDITSKHVSVEQEKKL